MIGTKSQPPISEGSFSVPSCGQNLLPSDRLAGGNVPPPASLIQSVSYFWSVAKPWIGDTICVIGLFGMLVFGLFLELILS
jgi:hypothetical protein